MLVFRKRDNALYADNEETLKFIESCEEVIGFGPPKKIRSIEFHRKFFSMLNHVYDNIEYPGSIDSFRKSVIINSGYYEPSIIFIDDEALEVRQAKSIAFDKMDESEFRKLYEAALQAIYKYYYPSDEFLDQFS